MNKKTTKKEITLNDLALMVAKGFDETNERMDKRFKQVEKRLDKIEAGLNKIDYNTLTYRVEKLEKKFA